MNRQSKGNKKLRIKSFLLTIITLFSISSLFIIYNIWIFNGIEDLLRYGIIFLLIIILGIFIFWCLKTIKKGRLKSLVIFTIIALLIGTLQFTASYYINRLYSSISKINKTDVTYGTSLITMHDSKIDKVDDLKNKKIGIIKDTDSIEGYIISQEIIADNDINEKNLIKYDDFLSMLNDLYERNVDAIFISSSYVNMFESIDHFNKIDEETKVIVSKEKTMSKQKTITNNTSSKITEPFTMLLMGIDSTKDDIKSTTSFNGDSLVLITFNPKTLNATILSIPRDTFVPIMCFKNHIQNKITHAAWYGESCMIATIENFTGIDIDYYVKINFKGVVKLVDAVGGVEVDVPYSLCEQNSNRAWGENTVFVEEGRHTLNGEQALALSRNRHKPNDGSSTGAMMARYCPKYNKGSRSDIMRGQNQQAVITALANKLKTIRDINKVYEILDLLEKNMDTNLSTNQILSFYNIGKNILEHSKVDENILSFQKLQLKIYGKMIYDEGMRLVLYNDIYYKGSLNEIVEAMRINLSLKEPTIIKEFAFSINEVYEEKIIGNGYYNEPPIALVPNFTSGYTQASATSWGSKNGVAISFTTTTSSDPKYVDGQIIDQSIPASSLVSIAKTKGITLTVVKKINTTPEKIDCIDENNKENPACKIPDFVGQNISNVNSWKSKITSSSITVSEKSNKDIAICEGKNNIVIDQTDDLAGKYIYDLDESKRILIIEYCTVDTEEETEEDD